MDSKAALDFLDVGIDLLIEENKKLTEYLKVALQHSGCQCVVCEEARQAPILLP
jgi:hypothetical protein